ncbi:AAA family ATPase [Alkalicoccobacillus gibsonii]|uniref:AAA family ATPase n=1 Tax=Alkalicoccobacillus gibsonii TaxID=79881 RepID=UPI003513A041
MNDFTLYTYHEEDLQLYKQSRQELNISVLSLASIEITQNKINDIIPNEEVDIDLSSAVATMNTELVYPIERLIYQLILSDKNITFIISEKYLDKAIKMLGTVFSGSSSILITNGKKKRKASSKVKLITNVRAEKLSKLKKHLDDNIVGHKYFKDRLIETIMTFKFFNKIIKDQPILSVFLLGKSGIGKTEVARALHSFLDNKNPLAKVNFANYSNESSLASLIGSSPGYKDSGTESDLMLKIRKSNSGILLVDEFEKADSVAHNFFLQVLEEGEFDDAMGTVHNLNGYVIIFTSNMTSKDFSKLPPELRSRFDMITSFGDLATSEKELFARKVIQDYVIKSKKHMGLEQINKILLEIDLESETNLRNIKKRIRHLFYQYTRD